MNKEITDDVIKSIRALYNSNSVVARLLDMTAQRKRDAKSISLESLCTKLGISRGEAVALARNLDETKCGEFIVGRRGQTSRFNWKYSSISLGRAATGELATLEDVADAATDSDEEDIEDSVVSSNVTKQVGKLSIADAKQGLADFFGVSINNIEIKITG